jgi:hypothetical protein
VKENDARVENEKHQVLLYVEKSDGSYGPLQTGAYMVTNYLDDYLLKIKHIHEECIEKLRKGEISPVVYYMFLNNMTASDVAVRVGISKAKVKKHEKPSGFARAPVEVVRRYADVFGTSMANMFQVVVPQEKDISIASKKTANPYLSVMEIGRVIA